MLVRSSQLARLAALVLLVTVPGLSAQAVQDPSGFSFTPPRGLYAWDGELPLEWWQGGYAYSLTRNPQENPLLILGLHVLNEPMVAGKIPEFPPGPDAALIRESWQNTPVYGVRDLRDLLGKRLVIIWIDLPLAQQTVRVTAVSFAASESTSRSQLRELVRSVSGPADLLSPAQIDPLPPPAKKNGESMAVYVILAIFLTGVAVAGTWFMLNRRRPTKPEANETPPPELDSPPHEEPPPPPGTEQPPWAATRNTPGPKAESDVPPWEYRP